MGGGGGVLPEQSWDQDICNLNLQLKDAQRLFSENLSEVLSNASNILAGLWQYKDFVSDIVLQSKCDIFKQLWKDVISNQMKKYGDKAIRVCEMDEIDVCLFLKSLKDKSKNE